MNDKEALWQAYLEDPTPAHRNAIAESYLYLAHAVARRFAGRGVEREDLVQVASLALLHAIDRFEPQRGMKFTTFAVPTIAGEVRNHLRDKARMVRLPRRTSELLVRLLAAQERFFQENGREATVAELAVLLEAPEDAVLQALEMRSGAIMLSLDAQQEEDGPTLAEQLGEEEGAFDRLEETDAVQSLLRSLPQQLSSVLRIRYLEGKSQRETAASLGVSQMQVSRLERKAIALLRKSREEML